MVEENVQLLYHKPQQFPSAMFYFTAPVMAKRLDLTDLYGHLKVKAPLCKRWRG